MRAGDEQEGDAKSAACVVHVAVKVQIEQPGASLRDVGARESQSLVERRGAANKATRE